MTIGLPRTKKRREILAAPKLLKVEATEMQLSKFTRVLLVGTLTLLYSMFIGGSINNIINRRFPDTEAFIKIFAVGSALTTIGYVAAILLIVTRNRSSLIFTEVGIAGNALITVKYSDLGGYAWETSSGFITTGQGSEERKRTLFITANKGWLPELRYETRFGTSVIASFGYYFTSDQIQNVNEIMARYGIRRLEDRHR